MWGDLLLRYEAGRLKKQPNQMSVTYQRGLY